MSLEQGVITNVYTEVLGAYLAADAASAAQAIVVDKIVDFGQNGGTLRLNGVTYTFTAADPDTATITIPAGLTSAAVTSDRVDLIVNGDVVSEKYAEVMQDHADDALPIRVPLHLRGYIPDGVRTSTNEPVEFDGDTHILTNVVGTVPQLDGATIDPATAPQPATDGLPPSSSPVLTARGNVGAIHYTWTPVANADPYRFKLYVSTTPGFTPGGGNLVAITAGSSFMHVPSPPDYTATYYARLVEFDDDGDATPSAEVSAQLRQADNTDISAMYAYLGDVLADQIRTGNLNADLANLAKITSRVAGTGAGYDLNNDGLLFYDSAGAQGSMFLPQNSKFKGDGEIENMTVTGQVAIRKAMEISRGAVATLQQGSTAPAAAPSVVVGWPDPVVLDKFSGDYGLVWTGTEFASLAMVAGGGSQIIERSTSADITLASNPSRYAWGGFTLIGSNWYTLEYDAASPGWYLYKYTLAGAGVGSVAYTPIAGNFGSGGNSSQGLAPAAIGTDGTNILIAELNASGPSFRVQVFNTSLSLTATYTSGTNVGFSGPVVGVSAGSFDFGSTRYVILSKNGAHHWPFTLSGSTLTYQPNDAWASPVPGSMSGFTWDGTRFWSTRAKNVANQAWIYKHTTHKWTGADPQTRYASSTWRDTDAGGTGLHETSMGPVVTFSMKKRAAVTFTGAAAIPDSGGNDDPDAVAFYLGNVDATRTNLFQQALPAAGVNTAVIGDSTTLSGTNPPSSNNFPNVTPGKIINPASTLVISANGIEALPETTWTPAFTAATTTPTLGTGGTQTGVYSVVGKWFFYEIRIVFGTSMNAGSGVYAFGLPAGITALGSWRGAGNCIFTRAASRFHYGALLVSATALGAVDQAGNRLQHNSVAWATNDEINLIGKLRLA